MGASAPRHRVAVVLLVLGLVSVGAVAVRTLVQPPAAHAVPSQVAHALASPDLPEGPTADATRLHSDGGDAEAEAPRSEVRRRRRVPTPKTPVLLLAAVAVAIAARPPERSHPTRREPGRGPGVALGAIPPGRAPPLPIG